MIARARQRSRSKDWAGWATLCALVVALLARRTMAGSTTGAGAALPVVTVAIDAGHGGTNLGATGPGRGVYEKNVTLALAHRLRELLKAGTATAPPIAVVLCREKDTLIPIRTRARCARESGARLFLSLHAKAGPSGAPPGTQRGFGVFVLGPREVEDDAALAELGEQDLPSGVWAAHEIRAIAEESVVLARVVSDHLTRWLGGAARRGVRQSGAALDILRGSGMPGALVEVGFLDHPEEGVKLASPEGREPIAQALTAAIREYVAESVGQYVGKSVPGGHDRVPTRP